MFRKSLMAALVAVIGLSCVADVDAQRPGRGGKGGRPGKPGQRLEGLFTRFDKDKDGKLTEKELPPFLWKRLSQADANKDGSLTKAELETFFKNRPKKGPRKGPGKGGKKDGPESKDGPGRKGGRPGKRLEGLFTRFDKDKDGKLTQKELPAPLWQRLSKADANKDGSLTKAELEAYFKSLPKKKGRRGGKPGQGRRRGGKTL